MSECSNFTDDDDEGGIGSFTSTVCVNFSEDDLRLATIPGQVEVNSNFLLNIVPSLQTLPTLFSLSSRNKTKTQDLVDIIQIPLKAGFPHSPLSMYYSIAKYHFPGYGKTSAADHPSVSQSVFTYTVA